MKFSGCCQAGTAATAVAEGGTITFTITRSASGTASTVYLGTRSGTTASTDHEAKNQVALTFAANETVN